MKNNAFLAIFIASSIALLQVSAVVGQSFSPVNPNAAPETKQLLTYLYSIYGKKILSGQHNYNHEMNRYSDSVKAITGKEPAVWSTDFIWNGMQDNGQAIVDESIRQWKRGELVTLMWHEGRPTDNPPYGWKESIQGKLSDAEWKELTTTGTVLYKRWLDQVDRIAGYLAQLRDAHVPVLWRPYHEMNGVWFWWGNRKGKDGVAKLWKMMYDRFTNYHHLNNLLWVWGANGPRDIPGDEAYAYKDFYPGAEYVDILGADVYHNDYEQRDYEELLALAKGKPIALTETGEMPSAAILAQQPKWLWFVVWTSWLWTDNTRERVREVYSRPETVTHGADTAAGTTATTEGHANAGGMHLNSQEYLEYEGVNVMLAHDFYPEGHQGGVGVIQHGQRVATNGDLRLEPTPGQWSPIPKVGKRMVDKAAETISVRMVYPDSSIDRKGFNPIIYPDLHFAYTIHVRPAGEGFRIVVDLEKPLPDDWVGKVGFNFELFPGTLFGKSWYLGSQSGIFPQQSNDQLLHDASGVNGFEVQPMAEGRVLTVAPESEKQRMTIEGVSGGNLQLLDGRGKHTNGWFVVRALVPKGATQHAIEWVVTPHAIPGWKSDPVVQVSQIGYHPRQQKIAVIELDKHDDRVLPVRLLRVLDSGGEVPVLTEMPVSWGDFLRYHYLRFDFSRIQEPGMYQVAYGSYRTEPFKIGGDVYQTGVWQPTLEYFLPVQMCHMRVNDKYRVWHGWCHLDDARMAPIDSNHFDGYIQGHSTLTRFTSGETVPGLNHGAWHDAGDYDLRVESQAETVHGLTLAYEQFKVGYDNTTIDQRHQVVEIQRPDGKPDMLQQIEHGLLSIVGGYRSMGRFYRGIIEPTLRQYTLLGDPANLTDNVFYHAPRNGAAPAVGLPGSPDDRWVFTEENPGRTLETAAALAAAARVMKGFNDSLARQCLQIAVEVWGKTREKDAIQRVALAVELALATREAVYTEWLSGHATEIAEHIDRTGWLVGRTLPLIKDAAFKTTVTDAVAKLYAGIQQQGLKTPYGLPYEPNIWGAGWGIQNFGYRQYFLHEAWPSIVGSDYMLDALNFVLGCHPGSNVSSFASGVGAKSMTTAYGFNRADRSYIPGGIASGTALIRPDFPELMDWPYFWQQGEYVLGGGTTDYLFLVLAADKVLNEAGGEAGGKSSAGAGSRAERMQIADSMEWSMRKELLAPWYPRAIDSADGGWLSSFTYDFKPTGTQDKMVVTQARHTWTNSRAASRWPNEPMFKTGAKQGFVFLRDKMWDRVHGGFYTYTDKKGNPKAGSFAPKEAYGNSFGIYACAAYYKSSGDTAALGLAKRAFYWLEDHSHDPVYGGYYQHMTIDGHPIARTSATDSHAETGYKDQNSSIHLLEAFTELYSVWKDDLLRARLQELLFLIRDRITDVRGDLVLFFQPDWTPVSFVDSSRAFIESHKSLNHASFGHDVETAYLMLEASEVLGLGDDVRTLAVGKRMVDHALKDGWDPVLGGFYDEGYYFKGEPAITILKDSKNWWAQAEGLNTLLLMADHFPDDAHHYFDKFKQLWKYTETYLIDHEHGDWYEEGLDKEPQRKTAMKGHIWKATYHNYRALSNCIDRLRGGN